MPALDATALPLRARVLLSVQRALIGEITPEMRAVAVDWSPTRIHLQVFTEGDVPDSVRDEFDACAVTQLVADFPYPDRTDPEVTFEFVRCDPLERVRATGVIVFARSGVLFAT